VIRALTRDDIHKVVQALQMWISEEPVILSHNWSSGFFLDRICDPGCGGQVALNEKDEVVGYIFYETTEDNILVFTQYFVRKDYRRRGIGTLLSDAAIIKVKMRDHWPCAARLTVATANAHAINIYEKYNMQRIKLITNYYGANQDGYMYQYVHNQDEYDHRKKPSGDLSTIIRLGLLDAVGVKIDWVTEEKERERNEQIKANKKELESGRKEKKPSLERTNSIFGESFKHVWLIDAPKSAQLLTPDQAQRLLDQNFVVTVEKSSSRSVPDSEYAILGCMICPSGSWRFTSPSTYILVPSDFDPSSTSTTSPTSTTSTTSTTTTTSTTSSSSTTTPIQRNYRFIQSVSNLLPESV